MTSAKHFDLIVIGSGSAASACWFNVRSMGKSVAVFEGDTLGGECPTYACVPTKALLQCAEVYDTVMRAPEFGISTGQVWFDYAEVKARKDFVVSQTLASMGEQPYRDMGVEVFRHYARFVGANEVEAGGERYTADKILIATGASQRVPEIPGLDEAGYVTFKDAIDLEEVPGALLILGGGAVGCEFTQLFATFGSAVAIADRNERLLHDEDPEVGGLIQELFDKRGVGVLLEATVLNVERDDQGKKRVTIQKAGRDGSLVVDEILIASGKSPNVDIGLDSAGVKYTESGVIVDDTMCTSNPNVYAAGDVAGPYLFTHAASYQGELAAHNMYSDAKRRADYRAMPRCVFTLPEVGTVGLTEAQAHAQGINVRIGMTPIDVADRALTSEQLDGFVKVLADESGRLIGGAIVAPRAGEMVQELALAISLGVTAQQVAMTIHAFPTFSEAVAAACAKV
jgi:pyruvate/2-oxoglutarate dehydrogenase complex dihydrolipoamide dehydrogenase (E3) component